MSREAHSGLDSGAFTLSRGRGGGDYAARQPLHGDVLMCLNRPRAEKSDKQTSLQHFYVYLCHDICPPEWLQQLVALIIARGTIKFVVKYSCLHVGEVMVTSLSKRGSNSIGMTEPEKIAHLRFGQEKRAKEQLITVCMYWFVSGVRQSRST